jgi:hypothetical protein
VILSINLFKLTHNATTGYLFEFVTLFNFCLNSKTVAFKQKLQKIIIPFHCTVVRQYNENKSDVLGIISYEDFLLIADFFLLKVPCFLQCNVDVERKIF